MKKLLYAGSFDPFTNGHLDVINQARETYKDKQIIIGIGISEKKTRRFDRDKMKSAIEKATQCKCVVYNGHTGAEALRLECYALLRGMKDTYDLEYEVTVAEFNKKNYGLDTIYFRPSVLEIADISSTWVKELLDSGKVNEIKSLVPKEVFEVIIKNQTV